MDGKVQMESPAALEAIKNALFPPSRKAEGGQMISGDALDNLEGARIDLERLGADPVCIRTIERVQQQLIEVSRILQAVGFQVRRP
jgi:hypothetical protein